MVAIACTDWQSIYVLREDICSLIHYSSDPQSFPRLCNLWAFEFSPCSGLFSHILMFILYSIELYLFLPKFHLYPSLDALLPFPSFMEMPILFLRSAVPLLPSSKCTQPPFLPPLHHPVLSWRLSCCIVFVDLFVGVSH